MKINLDRMGSAASDLIVTPADNNKSDNLVALDKAMEKVQFEWVSLEGDK